MVVVPVYMQDDHMMSHDVKQYNHMMSHDVKQDSHMTSHDVLTVWPGRAASVAGHSG